MEHIEIVQGYLFGDVKFLDFLVVLIFLDIFFGVIKAWKKKKLRSRTAWFGYVRKIGVFGIIIAANIIDTILGLNGTVAFGTVLFYIGNEILSITENCAELGIKIPSIVTDKLQVIQKEDKEKKGDKNE
ncbi:holin family protein [Metabacillus halosaccharovorans]|uniref:phage holin family protein n=1 Tax=Metabacillus halosaccharovorans TaxID=930124 RepID=UPI0034CE6EA5